MSLDTYERADACRVFCPLYFSCGSYSCLRLCHATVFSAYARYRRVFFHVGGLSRRREGNKGVDRRKRERKREKGGGKGGGARENKNRKRNTGKEYAKRTSGARRRVVSVFPRSNADATRRLESRKRHDDECACTSRYRLKRTLPGRGITFAAVNQALEAAAAATQRSAAG